MNNYNFTKTKKQSGFTLVELMITLAIAGVLLAYGLPAYDDFSIRQNLSNQTNNLLGDLNFARNLAVDKGTTVTVTSANGVNWEGGWTISQRLPDLSMQDVRITDALPGNLTITESNNLSAVNYDSIGSASQLMSFNVQHNRFPSFLNVNVQLSGMASSKRVL